MRQGNPAGLAAQNFDVHATAEEVTRLQAPPRPGSFGKTFEPLEGSTGTPCACAENFMCPRRDRTFDHDKTLAFQKADVQHVSFEVTVERSRGIFCGAFAGLERTSAGIERGETFEL